MRALFLAAVGAAALWSLPAEAAVALLALLRLQLWRRPVSLLLAVVRPASRRRRPRRRSGGPPSARPSARRARRIEALRLSGRRPERSADGRRSLSVPHLGRRRVRSRPDARRRQPRRGRQLHARVHGLHGRAQLCRPVSRCSRLSRWRRRCRRRPPKICARSRFRANAANRWSRRGAIATSAITGPSRRRASSPPAAPAAAPADDGKARAQARAHRPRDRRRRDRRSDRRPIRRLARRERARFSRAPRSGAGIGAATAGGRAQGSRGARRAERLSARADGVPRGPRLFRLAAGCRGAHGESVTAAAARAEGPSACSSAAPIVG